jgi:hypothetical protein
MLKTGPKSHGFQTHLTIGGKLLRFPNTRDPNSDGKKIEGIKDQDLGIISLSIGINGHGYTIPYTGDILDWDIRDSSLNQFKNRS